MSDDSRHETDSEREPRHRGPAVPDGEVTAAEAIRNVATWHDSRTYLFVAFMVLLFGRLAYDATDNGDWLRATGYAAIAVLATVLFVVDSAQLRSVRRNSWARWGVRTWWLLFPLLFSLVWLR